MGVVALTASWDSANVVSSAEPVGSARLGMNLSGPADWNSEVAFVDVFRQSRPWISQQQGQSWGKGPPLNLDAHGWVQRLDPGCWAESPLCTLEKGRYPSGTYTVLYDGQGQLEFSGAASISSSAPGRLKIHVDALKGGFFLKLMETNPSDYVRNIRVIMPGCETTYRENPWNSDFLKLWRGMACLRFMDFMCTNNSKISKWSERPTLDDATFSSRGVPLELMIDLVNRLEADAWFCMPHLADDNYVRCFAAMTKQLIDPERRVYVEYSNEVWNSSFTQNQYAGEQGQRLGFAEKPWEAAWCYTAHRSVQIFDIWQQEFGTERLVRVLSTQAANPYVGRQIAGFRETAMHSDALAIAPYLNFNVGPLTKPSEAEVAGWTVSQVLDYVEQHALPNSLEWVDGNRSVANQFGLDLLAYEGGQHFVGIAGGENNAALTAVLKAANSDPRLEKIYQAYFDGWQRAGGGLFCYYSSVGVWSKWGSWGLLQSLEDDRECSPKFRAVMQWAHSLGQPVLGPP